MQTKSFYPNNVNSRTQKTQPDASTLKTPSILLRKMALLKKTAALKLKKNAKSLVRRRPVPFPINTRIASPHFLFPVKLYSFLYSLQKGALQPYQFWFHLNTGRLASSFFQNNSRLHHPTLLAKFMLNPAYNQTQSLLEHLRLPANRAMLSANTTKLGWSLIKTRAGHINRLYTSPYLVTLTRGSSLLARLSNILCNLRKNTLFTLSFSYSKPHDKRRLRSRFFLKKSLLLLKHLKTRLTHSTNVHFALRRAYLQYLRKYTFIQSSKIRSYVTLLTAYSNFRADFDFPLNKLDNARSTTHRAAKPWKLIAKKINSILDLTTHLVPPGGNNNTLDASLDANFKLRNKPNSIMAALLSIGVFKGRLTSRPPSKKNSVFITFPTTELSAAQYYGVREALDTSIKTTPKSDLQLLKLFNHVRKLSKNFYSHNMNWLLKAPNQIPRPTHADHFNFLYALPRHLRKIPRDGYSLKINITSKNIFFTLLNSRTGEPKKVFSAGYVKGQTARQRRTLGTFTKLFRLLIDYLTQSGITQLVAIQISQDSVTAPNFALEDKNLQFYPKQLLDNNIKVQRWYYELRRPHSLPCRAPKLRRK